MEVLERLATDNIVFPGFGVSLSVDPDAFTIFGLSIKWYGIMIALGMLLAMIYGFSRTKEFGLDSDRVIDAVFAGVIGAVIGARLYYVTLHSESYHDIKSVLAIRDGGLAIYGGIIGALLFGCITAKIRKVKVLPLLDVASPCLFIGQCLGRWGNFFNQEAFGSNTALPWGMSGGRIQNYLMNHQAELAGKGIDVDPFLPVHPCFLYESLWCGIGFLLLHFYHKKRKFDGEMFCMYALWYGLGRAFIEGLRTDSLYIGGVRASQALAVISSVTALAIIRIIKLRIKKNGYTLFRDTDEAREMLLAEEAAEREYAERKAAKKAKKNELSEDQKIISDDTDE